MLLDGPSSFLVFVRKKPKVIWFMRLLPHRRLFCSRQLDSLTSLAIAAPSTGTRLRLVVHIILFFFTSHDDPPHPKSGRLVTSDREEKFRKFVSNSRD
ncbi:hypothetical protein AVEN_90621-1 [Araneus ventricosus]|uniref:Uncharacterized protein n=1 Tax=Araneus ventricosus TaxID=182803 RepID=A0A4Y2NMF6_ARAVE|nr:hypothetical protein AVEN_138360-1 [Araneus ventricosus]GBN40705.1 hypothetical protein AVEN_156236-1 [Araneus ventricosus]GBN46349.1 hypothetical protein AVEN_228308-1 [Araneus ventricosus]GBN46368.1 hypothetical protein AVEN_90621-1 [Araneus ventricosus]